MWVSFLQGAYNYLGLERQISRFIFNASSWSACFISFFQLLYHMITELLSTTGFNVGRGPCHARCKTAVLRRGIQDASRTQLGVGTQVIRALTHGFNHSATLELRCKFLISISLVCGDSKLLVAFSHSRYVSGPFARLYHTDKSKQWNHQPNPMLIAVAGNEKRQPYALILKFAP